MRLSQKRSLLFLRQNGRGFALILVLAFTALLTALALAFLSNSLGQRQVASASANQVKVTLLATGAVDSITGYLQDEIAAGSDDVTPTQSNTTVYSPKAPSDMVPYRLPAWTGNNALNNLVKISGQTFDSRINVPTSGTDTTEKSANGRYVENARWLEPLFLPTETSLPNTPKWIEVSSDGSGSSSKVVGRYAFVIYDEGGLLDLNVAGYPDTDVATKWDHTMDPASKSAVAYADLTQIPGLTQANIDALINWRNAASVTAPGYKNYVQSNTTGFLRTSNTDLSAGKSDEMLTGRQQMISLLTGKLGWNKDTLQYLTSYSRDLNQPSLAPDHTKLPQLQPLANGGNDQVQSDYDTINPKFLQVRVQSGFTRNDGSSAAVGDPLVKQRFALNRLAWLTYLGPSSGRTGADITDLTTNLGISRTWIDQGTADNIRKYFGLEWEPANNCWRYNIHLNANGEIKTLADVARGTPGDPPREPDFFEILKASIATGALGKSGSSYSSRSDISSPTYLTDPTRYQFYRDSTVDFQVMQIGANIIDQSDVDGYPTLIRMGPTSADSDPIQKMEVRGVENLPYLYRVRNGVYRTADASGGTGGQFEVVQEPEIWNPHSYNSANINRSLGNPRPTSFQLVAFSGQSVLAGTPTLNNIAVTSFSLRSYDSSRTQTGSINPLTEANGTLTFQIPNEKLFREPTLLVKANVPNASQLSSPSGAGRFTVLGSPPACYNAGEPGSPGQYLGIPLGFGPLTWSSGAMTANGAEVDVDHSGGITYQLRYQPASSSTGMAIYDEKYFRLWKFSTRLSESNAGLNFALDGGNENSYQTRAIIPADTIQTCVDPRTSRFGMMLFDTGHSGFQSVDFPPLAATIYSSVSSRVAGPFWVNRNDNTLYTNRPDTTAGWSLAVRNSSNWPADEWIKAFPGSNQVPANAAKGWYWDINSGTVVAGWNWNNADFRIGLLSQNISNLTNDRINVSANFSSTDPSKNMVNPGPALGAFTYYCDADGVVRRGMGGYALSTPSSGTTVQAQGLPMAVAYNSASAAPTNRQWESRPIILNRPFQSVGELGYVFSDTPWKNLNFSFAESGFSPLLDAFCINDSDSALGLVAGKVNLNTASLPVLHSILSQAYRNAYASSQTTQQSLNSTEVGTLSTLLYNRLHSSATTGAQGPLTNLDYLVGRWVPGTSPSANNINGRSTANYDGFANDLDGVGDAYQTRISRYRETAVRALAANSTVRTWNLMIDLIAQSGRSTTNGFFVDGEQHYWIHLAVDRYTGKVLDQIIEPVKE